MIRDKAYLETWAKKLIEDWQADIAKRKIGNKGVLAASFKQTVTEAAGGNIEKIKFAYEWYGKMVKLGVGKGQKLDDVKDSSALRKLAGKRGPGRRAKNWKDGPYKEATQALYAESFRRSRAEARKVIDLAGRITLNF